MHRALRVLVVCGLALGLAASAQASATSPEAVTVQIRRHVGVREDVRVSFRAGGQLPQGGYYYAVIVLTPYKRYTRGSPPPCATSSNMERTDYGYPRADRSVTLTLTRAASPAAQWCRGGAYVGAIYAVPHAPPCESRYPCRSEPYERSPCWEIETGRRVCGVVAPPRRYQYPDSLLAPLASGTRIVARFEVAFPAR